MAAQQVDAIWAMSGSWNNLERLQKTTVKQIILEYTPVL